MLSHAIRETGKPRVNALVFVGDATARKRSLGCVGSPVSWGRRACRSSCSNEGRDPTAAAAFKQIAAVCFSMRRIASFDLAQRRSAEGIAGRRRRLRRRCLRRARCLRCRKERRGEPADLAVETLNGRSDNWVHHQGRLRVPACAQRWSENRSPQLDVSHDACVRQSEVALRGVVPRIQVFPSGAWKAWMAGSSPAKTTSSVQGDFPRTALRFRGVHDHLFGFHAFDFGRTQNGSYVVPLGGAALLGGFCCSSICSSTPTRCGSPTI